MPEIGIGTIKHEEIGEACDRNAAMRFRPMRPDIVQLGILAADDFHRRQKIGRLEAGREDDRVDAV